MAINFPAAIDSFGTYSGVAPLGTAVAGRPHSLSHTDVGAAIVVIQGILGTLTSGGSHVSTGGMIFRQAATQDGIGFQGRAGGAGDFKLVIRPDVLVSDTVLVAPNSGGTIATTDNPGLFTPHIWTVAQTFAVPVLYGTQVESTSATIAAGRVKFTGSTASQTLTLPPAAEGTEINIRNAATVTVTVARDGTDTIEGAATLSLEPGASVSLTAIGSDWTALFPLMPAVRFTSSQVIAGNNAASVATSVAIGGGASATSAAAATAAGATAIGANDGTSSGTGARATGAGSVALGGMGLGSGGLNSAVASGHASIALGGGGNGLTGAVAAGSEAIALGASAATSGNGAIAIGRQTSAGFTYSVAFGPLASATKANQIVIGAAGGATCSEVNIPVTTPSTSTTTGALVVAGGVGIGGAMTALSYRGPSSGALANSVIIGNGAVATTSDSVAIGSGASASASGEPIAIGYLATATAIYTLAIGRQANATAPGATALGFFANATHTNSVALGYQAVTAKANQIVLGKAANHTEVTIPATTEATSPTAAALVVAGGIGAAKDAVLSSTSSIYLGDAATDGTWRYTRSGNDLLFQRRESGVWVTKLTIAA